MVIFTLLFSGQVAQKFPFRDEAIYSMNGAHALTKRRDCSHLLLAVENLESCWCRRHTEMEGDRKRTEQSLQAKRLLASNLLRKNNKEKTKHKAH